MKYQPSSILRTLFLSTFFSIAITSCTEDEDPIIEEPTDIAISISNFADGARFLFQGDVLEVQGENFVNEEHDTKIYINNELTRIAPKSNTLIEIPISDDLSETNTLQIKISDFESEVKSFFVMQKGWQKIDTYGELDIIKSFVFEGSNSIMSLVDIMPEWNIYLATAKKLNADSIGYENLDKSLTGGLADLEMIDINTGVGVGGFVGYYTTDSFESYTKFGQASIISGSESKVASLSLEECIITDSYGGHAYTQNGGESATITNFHDYLVDVYDDDSRHYKGALRTFGVASDGYHYELGTLYDSNPERNLILKSANGYDNWQVVDSTTVDSRLWFATFIDKDLILAKYEDDLWSSTDLANSWTKVTSNIQAYFSKNKKEFYVVSDDQLLYSNNSGASWTLELELPESSEVNHMFFSETKTILSGNAGLLYIKHE